MKIGFWFWNRRLNRFKWSIKTITTSWLFILCWHVARTLWTQAKEEVRGYIFEAIEFLVRKGADIIVIACNTATSIAVNDLREKYQIPIIGMEPAVKPAIEWVQESGKRVLVTATPLTLKKKNYII